MKAKMAFDDCLKEFGEIGEFGVACDCGLESEVWSDEKGDLQHFL